MLLSKQSFSKSKGIGMGKNYMYWLGLVGYLSMSAALFCGPMCFLILFGCLPEGKNLFILVWLAGTLISSVTIMPLAMIGKAVFDLRLMHRKYGQKMIPVKFYRGPGETKYRNNALSYYGTFSREWYWIPILPDFSAVLDERWDYVAFCFYLQWHGMNPMKGVSLTPEEKDLWKKIVDMASEDGNMEKAMANAEAYIFSRRLHKLPVLSRVFATPETLMWV